MSVKFGSARIDERGNAVNGAAGDNNGKEVWVENFYMHDLGWYCYRPKDAQVANRLAEEMKDACNNNNIGYDQYNRISIITLIKKYGHMKAIAELGESDCGTLVRGCIYAATGIDAGNFTTCNEGKALEATGLFEPKFKVKSADELYTGDVLVTCKKGHTGIIVSGKARTKESSDDGKLSKIPKWVGQVTAHLLNVRTWAGTEFPRITKWTGGQLAKGNKVDVCDTINDSKGKPWYYIRIAGSIYGFVDARYIKRVS